MRGAFLIATLITSLIIGLIYVKRLKTVPQVVPKKILQEQGIEVPETMQQVPGAVKKSVNKTMEEYGKKALDGDQE